MNRPGVPFQNRTTADEGPPPGRPEAPIAIDPRERYEKRGELGRGGMGAVFRMYDRALGREVAVKLLHPDISRNEHLIARFIAEARATAGLQHPAIVPVYDIGLDPGGNVFFSMMIVEGQTLVRIVEKGETSLFRLLEIFVEVGRAIGFAHERGIIHRDLKPQNVMIGRHGEVHVMDWGLVKHMRGPAEIAGAVTGAPVPGPAAGATIAGTIVGTPGYMAPEQASSKGEVGPCSDVYALGAVLYYIVTRRPPFEGDSHGDILGKSATGQFDRPRVARHDVPAEIEAIILKAMALQPADRYPTANELANDVQAYLEHEPIVAYPETRAQRALKWARKHRGALVVGSVAVAIALATGGVASWVEQRTEARRDASVRAAALADAKLSLAAADDAAAKAIRAIEATPRPIWERRAEVLKAGELREYFARPPADEIEARDRLEAAGDPEAGGPKPLARWKATQEQHVTGRREAARLSKEANERYARARVRMIEGGDRKAADRVEGQRLFHLGRIAAARGGPEAAAYLEAAMPLLGKDDPIVVEHARARLAKLRVSLKAGTARASIFAVDPETLETADRPLDAFADAYVGIAEPLRAAGLEPGEYIVRLRDPEGRGEPISFPVLLAPGDDWVTELPIAPADVPAGFVYVPAGPFLLGTTQTTEWDDKLMRFISVPHFFIGRNETTLGQFKAFVRETRHVTRAQIESKGFTYVDCMEEWTENIPATYDDPFPMEPPPADLDGHPVTLIDPDDAAAYAKHGGVRLPTEIEWEKAARGIDGRHYSWGEERPDADGILRANFKPAGGRDADGFGRTAPVGSFPRGASPYGALDMMGNIWEWVAGDFGPYTTIPPETPKDGKKQYPLRGGCFLDEVGWLRTSLRYKYEKGYRDCSGGMRVARKP